MPAPRTALALAALVLSLAAPLAAQHGAAAAPSAGPADTATVPLLTEALGDFAWPVNTASPEAATYFQQGVRLMYAFARKDAQRSFAEARRLDPRCAMCWWGEAWAMGPYLNGAMSDADAPLAHAAARRARSLARRGDPVERALAEAMTARYRRTHGPAGRKGLDSAYAAAMERVHARFPDNLEVAALYADALMLLEPRRGTWSVEKPSVARIHEVLERGLAVDVAHPGLCHAYIHATETTPRAERAQRCADLLMTEMPGASHLNHMPSHTYNRVGRWNDAVRSNVIAWESDRRAAEGKAVSIYPLHNLHMLFFAASVDGQERQAVEAADSFAVGIASGDGASMRGMVRVRFGRFAEVLTLTDAPPHAVHRGLWAFARGYAHLRTGSRDSAAAYLARTDSLAEHTPAETTFRGHTAANLLGVVGGILRGELLRAEGRADDALAALERAVELEDGLTFDEPEPLPFAARDWLGAALLEAGRAGDAERVYRAALDDRPRNGWSLFGLEQALRAQGKTAEADRTRAAFTEAWARSETTLTASQF